MEDFEVFAENVKNQILEFGHQHPEGRLGNRTDLVLRGILPDVTGREFRNGGIAEDRKRIFGL